MKKIILRGIAFYLDGLVFTVLTFVLFFLHHYLLGDLKEQTNNFNSFDLMPYHILSYFIYFVLSEYFFNTTLGKKIFSFQIIVNKNSSSLFVKILIRTFTRIIPINPISFLFNKNQIFWHETWSNIKTEKS
tara:strand:+ start:559 stop:951 length:393 start_codon:yes stop_codon:yes gene_type:complete